MQARALTPAGDTVRVVLLQRAASLLAGDRVEVRVRVGEGSRLELVELAATIAHDVRGGAPCSWSSDAEVEAGGRLVWAGAPLVASAGTAVCRATRVTLGPDAVALMRETLVLGRAGQSAGHAQTSLLASHQGVPLLAEGLDTSEPALRSIVVAGPAKVIAGLALLGKRPPVDVRWADALTLRGPGASLVATAQEAHVAHAHLAPTAAAWTDLALDTHREEDGDHEPGLALRAA